MTSEVVYLLIGDTGEYSDRVEWFVRAYKDKAQADAECEELNKLAEGIEKLGGMERDKAVRARLMPHDANAMVDYTGTRYTVAEVPLV